MNQPVVWMNGAYREHKSAKISIEDRGFQFSDGVYEVIRSVGGRYFGFPQHLSRLRKSLQAVEIEVSMQDKEFLDVGTEMLSMRNSPDAILYIQITRGTAPRSHSIPRGISPTIIMTLRAYQAPPDGFYSHGISVLTVNDERWLRCDIKSTGLLASILGRERARRAGANDAVFVRDGCLTEATSANIFVVQDGIISTPIADYRILSGITRDVVIDISRAQGRPLKERNIAATELKEANEAFITSTTFDVVPVVKCDEQIVGSGKVGPITLQLLEAYRNRIHARS
jgi:D-alanine transaminase